MPNYGPKPTILKPLPAPKPRKATLKLFRVTLGAGSYIGTYRAKTADDAMDRAREDALAHLSAFRRSGSRYDMTGLRAVEIL
jgi:hypothetical protein